ncbi:MAG: hypothetical protein ACRCSS_18220 [Shewanella sp.]
MLSPISRLSMLQSVNEKQPISQASNKTVMQNLTDALEELSMSRTLFDKKDKDLKNKGLSSFIESNQELKDIVSKIKKIENIKWEDIEVAYNKISSEIGKYQILRHLLTLDNLSADIIILINKKLNELKKKRKKISSLDRLDDAITDGKLEGINGLMLGEVFISYLEYDGHVSDFTYELSKNYHEYNTLMKELFRLIGYEIFSESYKNEMENYIFLNAKRRDIQQISNVYDDLLTGKLAINKNNISVSDFVYKILSNLELEKIVDVCDTNELIKISNYFSKIPSGLFYSQTDKDLVIAFFIDKVTRGFLDRGIR